MWSMRALEWDNNGLVTMWPHPVAEPSVILDRPLVRAPRDESPNRGAQGGEYHHCRVIVDAVTNPAGDESPPLPFLRNADLAVHEGEHEHPADVAQQHADDQEHFGPGDGQPRRFPVHPPQQPEAQPRPVAVQPIREQLPSLQQREQRIVAHCTCGAVVNRKPGGRGGLYATVRWSPRQKLGIEKCARACPGSSSSPCSRNGAGVTVRPDPESPGRCVALMDASCSLYSRCSRGKDDMALPNTIYYRKTKTRPRITQLTTAAAGGTAEGSPWRASGGQRP